MINRVKKVLILTGILCVIGITLCACQGTKEVSDENQNQEEIGGTDSKEKDIPNEDREQEDPSETNSEDDADDTLNQESNTENTDETNGSQSGAKGGEINTSAPNVEGTIKEIQEKQLTVVEYITEECENGGDIMVGPGSGDDSEFSKVTVTYDDNTVFVIKNIYDGGARSETENGTSSDLTTGQMVEIWGTSAADGLQATQICIVKVVLD